MVVRSTPQESSRHSQGLTRNRAKICLSKEARVEITQRRREARGRFKQALDDAWQAVDDTAVKISVDHKKSIRRVLNDLHMGHSLLRSKHSKVSAWNAFIWKKRQDGDKETSKPPPVFDLSNLFIFFVKVQAAKMCLSAS